MTTFEEQLQNKEKEINQLKEILCIRNEEIALKSDELSSLNEELETTRTEMMKSQEKNKLKREEMTSVIARLQELEQGLQEQVSDLTEKLATSEVRNTMNNTVYMYSGTSI